MFIFIKSFHSSSSIPRIGTAGYRLPRLRPKIVLPLALGIGVYIYIDNLFAPARAFPPEVKTYLKQAIYLEHYSSSPQNASVYFSAAVKECERLGLPQDSDAVTGILIEWAGLEERLGRFQKAATLYERTLKALLGPASNAIWKDDVQGLVQDQLQDVKLESKLQRAIGTASKAAMCHQASNDLNAASKLLEWCVHILLGYNVKTMKPQVEQDKLKFAPPDWAIPHDLSLVCEQLADVYALQGKEEALGLYRRALQLSVDHGFDPVNYKSYIPWHDKYKKKGNIPEICRQATIQNNISSILFHSKLLPQARDQAKTAFAISERNNHPACQECMEISSCNLGSIFLAMGDYDNAGTYFSTCQDLAKKFNDTEGLQAASNGLAECKRGKR